ncbi:Hypothetical predicted protein [Olea europaea subsp. europaea]|uniref:Uncharacterized protein n=1 Tax=Olea europaea subsp. europaea TaxID=158383 RepID=A0A8S0R480_OLEEU|nr:Hypothetical predicted protein [Olea europaea subsp. europaea]
MRLKLEISRRIKSMGCSQTKEKSSPGKKAVEGLKNKVRLLQGEINEIMSIRESENQAYQCELMVFAFKQAEWRRERRRLKDEVKKLRKRLEGKKERLRCTEESVMVNEKYNNEWLIFDKSSILAHIKEKQARREETVEKWKQLYFAIKVELDDLIQRTHQERLCWKGKEEEILLEMEEELRAKEEKIEFLQAKLDSLKQQECKREREIDILRQSLRIMSHRKKAIPALHQGHNRYHPQYRSRPKIIP